jgi:hypothetical protein
VKEGNLDKRCRRCTQAARQVIERKKYLPQPRGRQEANMPTVFHNTEKSEASRARTIRGRNGGTLTPFRPGEGQRVGYRKPNNYVETLHLARKSSPDAMRTLIKCLNDPDSRTAVVAANSILERAWGKVREQKPEEQHQASIDLSALTDAELALLLKLADSGRLRPAPDAQTDDEIEGEVHPMGGAQHER